MGLKPYGRDRGSIYESPAAVPQRPKEFIYLVLIPNHKEYIHHYKLYSHEYLWNGVCQNKWKLYNNHLV